MALALSNMAAITALTAVVRDSQRTTPEVTLLTLPVRIPLSLKETKKKKNETKKYKLEPLLVSLSIESRASINVEPSPYR